MHVIATPALRVTVSDVGARIAEIVDASGRNRLAPATRDEPTDDPAVTFAEGTRGGWDECLPSIDPELDHSTERLITDHGDFWFRPWTLEATTSTELRFDSTPIDHSLHMRKAVRVVHDRLEIDYEITNAAPVAYRFLYSSHPLFTWPATARIGLPGAGRIVAGFGYDDAEGIWPNLGSTDVSRIARAEPIAVKYYVEWAGEASVRFGDGSGFTLRQSPDTTPWLGVCANHLSWPPDDPSASWIALEATTSATDSLRSAIDQGSATALEPAASVSWTTTVEFW